MKEITLDVGPETLNINIHIVVQSSEYDAYQYRKDYVNDTSELKNIFKKSGLKEVSAICTFPGNTEIR